MIFLQVHHFIHTPAHRNSPPRRSWPVDKRPLCPRAIATNPKCHPRPQREKISEAHHWRIRLFETNQQTRLWGFFDFFWGAQKFFRHKKKTGQVQETWWFLYGHRSKKMNETSIQLKVSHVSLIKVTKRNPSPKVVVAHHNLSLKCHKITVHFCCQEWMNSLVAFVKKSMENQLVGSSPSLAFQNLTMEGFPHSLINYIMPTCWKMSSWNPKNGSLLQMMFLFRISDF